jgi:hypothetical protein
MQEVIYYPVHGMKRGGTGYSCLGGFAFGAGFGDAVTLKADRPTDLFSPSLTSDVERDARRADGDKWLDRTPIEGTLGPVAHAQRVKKSALQPASVALTRTDQAGRGAAKAADAKAKSMAKTREQVKRVQAALMAGKLNPREVKARAEKVANHGYRMGLAANDAYNAIALIEARIRARAEAGAPGKSLAAHRRVLARLRANADRLHEIAARDTALANAVSEATLHAAGRGISDYIQLQGYGQEPTGDARDAEELAVQQVVQASNELAADNVGAAEVTIANAEVSFQAADRNMSAMQAAGDVFADVSKALEPGGRINLKKVPVWVWAGIAALWFMRG